MVRAFFPRWLIATLLGLALILPANLVRAAGIPTIDVAAIAQMVSQLEQMKREYDQMLKEYKQLQDMTATLEGVNGIGGFMRNEDLVDMFEDLKDTDLTEISPSSLPPNAEYIYYKRGYDNACNGLKNDALKLCEQSMSILALGEYSFNKAAEATQLRIDRVDDMLDEIDKCQTTKQIQDLQARIQGEFAMIEVSQINMELQKNRLKAASEALAQQKATVRANWLFGTNSNNQEK